VRKVTFPLQVVIESPKEILEAPDVNEYGQEMQTRMHLAHEIARKTLKRKTEHQKRYYESINMACLGCLFWTFLNKVEKVINCVGDNVRALPFWRHFMIYTGPCGWREFCQLVCLSLWHTYADTF
jgi:hypothetical protein